MADTQFKVQSIPSLRARSDTRRVVAAVPVVDAADTVHTVAVVFDQEFINPPEIHGAVTVDAASAKGVPSVSAVTTTGMTVNLYQALAGALATQDHNVHVTYSGERKP